MLVDADQTHLATRSTMKDHVRSLSAEQTMAESSLDFPVTGRLFHVFKDLAANPHGRMHSDDAPGIPESLREHRNGHTPRNGRPRCKVATLESRWTPQCLEDERAPVACPGSPVIVAFKELGIDFLKMLLWVLDGGSSQNNQDFLGENAVAKWRTFGHGQMQSVLHQKTKCFLNHTMPFPSFAKEDEKKVQKTEAEAQEARVMLMIGKIMHLTQKYLDSLHEGEGVHTDCLRSHLFGFPCCRSFWPKSTARSEFVDVFVKKGANLNWHVDNQNCQLDRHQCGDSCSYLIGHKGEVCRANLCKCSWKACGEFMTKLGNVDEDVELVFTRNAAKTHKPWKTAAKKMIGAKTKTAKKRPGGRRKGKVDCHRTSLSSLHCTL